jgi:hypothetical protein
MTIIVRYSRHRHAWHETYDHSEWADFPAQLVEDILMFRRTSFHHNHGSPHQGKGSTGTGLCAMHYNTWRLQTLPSGLTYTEYVISDDPLVPGVRRLIVSSGAESVEGQKVVSPVFYYTDDHYVTYYKLDLTQVIHVKFSDNDEKSTTTTNIYGGKHTTFS